MLKRTVFTLSAVTAAARLTMAASSALSGKDARPNIIFIMADDLGFSDLRCFGGEAATPNLDRLAAEGVRFNQFYNCGKCEPTRAALMTGHRNTPQIGFLAERAKTFMPAVLKDQGYRTILSGKWHVSHHPLDRGFERFFGMEEGSCDYYTGSGRLQLGREKFPVPAEGFYTTDAFTDYALKFLDEAKKQNDAQPFFLYLAYNAPHDPLQVPEDEIAKYRGKYLEGWETIQQRRFARVKELGLIPPSANLPLWPQNLPHWNELTEAQKKNEDLSMATYTAMIDRMDQNIGRILQWLDKNGERENTLIIFVSDNGANPFGRLGMGWAHVCDTPFRLYKRNQHEGGICAPMIMRGPSCGYAPGSVATLPVHVLDFLPTFYALAGGAGRPEDIEGTDLSGLWKTAAQNRDYEMMSYLVDHRYIRRNDWKLVSVDGQPWELYNVAHDRTETDNLIAKNPEKAQELQAAWEKWYGTFSKKEFEVGKVSKRSRMGDQGSGVRYDPSAAPKTEEE